MSQLHTTPPRPLNKFNSPRDKIFTLNDINHSPGNSKSPTRDFHEQIARPKRVEMLRNTGTFGNSIDSEHQRSAERRFYRGTPQRIPYENLDMSRGPVEEELIYSEGPVTKRFLGHMHGNPRIKFDLRRKNINVAEFRSKLPEEQQGNNSDKENTASPMNIEKKILSHKDFVENLVSVEKQDFIELQVEKTPMIKCLALNKEKHGGNNEEAKKLLERKLQEANEKIKDLEQREPKENKGEEYQRHYEAFKKSVDVNLHELFGKFKIVKNLLGMNQLHIESVMTKYNEFMRASEGGSEAKKEKLGKELKVEMEDLAKILNENQNCIEDFSKINPEFVTQSLFDVLKRDFEFPKDQLMKLKEHEIEDKLKEKIEIFIEEGEMREKRFTRISQRIAELEELLRDNEGLSNTTKKMIELEKKLSKTQEENEGLESEYRKLKRENEKMNHDILKMSSEFEGFKNLGENEGLKNSVGIKWEGVGEIQVNIREYIQKVENELLKTKADLLKLGNENEVLKSVNKQYEIMSEKLLKTADKLKIEKKELQSEIEKQNNSNNLSINNANWKNEKRILEQTIERLEEDIKYNKQVQNSKEQEMTDKIKQLQSELDSTKIELNGAIMTIEASNNQLETMKSKSYHDEKDSKKREAIEQLSMIILSKDKSINMSDETKRTIHEIFGEKFSEVVDTYEDRIATLQDNEKKFYDKLKTEVLFYFWPLM